jgi:microcompartment protein CcmK/EutM
MDVGSFLDRFSYWVAVDEVGGGGVEIAVIAGKSSAPWDSDRTGAA